jgi:hypothetical protein
MNLILPVDAEYQMADAILAFRRGWSPRTEDQFASWLLGWMQQTWTANPSTEETPDAV